MVSSPAADIKPGNCLPLENIPVGTVIHNIELYPGRGAQLVRSAGVAAQLMAKEGNMATIRMPSGEMRKVRMDCRATIGQVGNIDHANVSIGKAGRVLFEIAGVSEETAREALRLASHKLPCKTKIVSKADTENGGE